MVIPVILVSITESSNASDDEEESDQSRHKAENTNKNSEERRKLASLSTDKVSLTQITHKDTKCN